MKILQINNCHYRRGGADVVYLNTGELLEKKGHQVIYFSQKSKNNYKTDSSKYFIEGIDFFEKSMVNRALSTPRFFYSTEAKNKLDNLLVNEKPDIAHIHLYKGTLTPSILKSLSSFSIPIILTLHDFGLLCPHNLFLDGKNKICERCVGGSTLNCIIHKCNHNNIILSTISALEFNFNKYFFSFEKYFSKIITVSNFAYLKHLKAFPERASIFTQLFNFYKESDQSFSLNKRGNYFLYYGRLSREKGINNLLNVWKGLNRDLHLKIVGTGEQLQNLTNLKDQENLSNVEISGHIEGERLDELIRNSSFIIVPSEWYENNPLTVIEAYSQGKPVIASNVGGLPEIVLDGITGFLFEMGNSNALSEAITKANNLSNSEYESFSKNARNFTEEKFNEEKHYKRLMEIYQEAVFSRRNNYA
jgi:glycosyltransferase involved in cell wall biosynthesis